MLTVSQVVCVQSKVQVPSYTDTLSTLRAAELCCRILQQLRAVNACLGSLLCSAGVNGQIIDFIEHLTAGSKAALKRHVQTDEFGANLGADCDELFKEALQENLPGAFNALERTAVTRVLQHPGECLN